MNETTTVTVTRPGREPETFHLDNRETALVERVLMDALNSRNEPPLIKTACTRCGTAIWVIKGSDRELCPICEFNVIKSGIDKLRVDLERYLRP